MYRVVEIKEIVDETPTIKTFFFEDNSDPKPGQFYMIWLPGTDEFPMSISYIGKKLGFTVKRIGLGTKKMHSLKEGDKIWIRGPYGRGFEIINGTALIVGGGSGVATLGPLMDRVKGDVIIAARNKEELLFTNRLQGGRTYLATDDGSAGFKGFATELAEILLEREKYDIIYTCGPEIMMKKIIDMALECGIRVQASLERLMKCGIGICDSCTINGYRVCMDGPVFNESELKHMEDLGKYQRDASGRRVPI